MAVEPSTQTVAPILLPEILGFSPHLLLDDVIDIANDAIRLTVDAMEEFILRWADERAKTSAQATAKTTKTATGSSWDGKTESEMGIISLQTLLESHTDLAFDAFEAWSLRNIFTFAPELPIVVPHQRGLSLYEARRDELALMDEIGELRRELETVREFSLTIFYFLFLMSCEM
jgi:kinetochore protein Mis12/MTW1